MKKSKRRSAVPSISEPEENVIEPYEKQKRFWSGWSMGERTGAIAVCFFLSLAAFGAGLKYLEDSARQQMLNAKNSSSKENASLLNSINPFVEPPLPTATPQLSKEYVYAGSRMLAVEDANASAAPPADLAVWRPSTGYWYVLGGQGSAQTSVQWGSSSDEPVAGDYDGDGKTDFSVFRASTGNWYIVRSSDSSNFAYSFGQTGDKPTAADFDGDGKTDAAVYRPNTTTGNATWYIQRSSDSGLTTLQFGLNGDTPAPGDFDGDGKADIAVWRSSTSAFYILRSSSQSYQTITGQTGSEPVVGDYDGDGKADAAVRNGNNWVITKSSNNGVDTIAWQSANYKAVQNDYDGDGKVDVAVWRGTESSPGAGDAGYWFIRQSSHIGQSNELRAVQWGSVGDYPVPAFYRR